MSMQSVAAKHRRERSARFERDQGINSAGMAAFGRRHARISIEPRRNLQSDDKLFGKRCRLPQESS